MKDTNSAMQIILRNQEIFTDKKVILINPTHGMEVLELQNLFQDLCVISNDWEIYSFLQNQEVKVFSNEELEQIPQDFVMAILMWGKNRDESWNYVVAMQERQAQLYLTGGNKSGVKNAYSKLNKLGININKLDSARHAQLYEVLEFNQTLQAIAPQKFEFKNLSITTMPGVFSAGRVDKGTQFLLEYLDKNALAFKPKVLDLGCGAGFLGMAMLADKQAEQVVGADKSMLAVQNANANYQANKLNAKAFFADVFEGLPADKFDLIISNPPFHENFAISTEFMQKFLQQAKAWLNPKGEIIIVANNFLPYAKIFAEHFKKWSEADSNSSFKIYRAEV